MLSKFFFAITREHTVNAQAHILHGPLPWKSESIGISYVSIGRVYSANIGDKVTDNLFHKYGDVHVDREAVILAEFVGTCVDTLVFNQNNQKTIVFNFKLLLTIYHEDHSNYKKSEQDSKKKWKTIF